MLFDILIHFRRHNLMIMISCIFLEKSRINVRSGVDRTSNKSNHNNIVFSAKNGSRYVFYKVRNYTWDFVEHIWKDLENFIQALYTMSVSTSIFFLIVYGWDYFDWNRSQIDMVQLHLSTIDWLILFGKQQHNVIYNIKMQYLLTNI